MTVYSVTLVDVICKKMLASNLAHDRSLGVGLMMRGTGARPDVACCEHIGWCNEEKLDSSTAASKPNVSHLLFSR